MTKTLLALLIAAAFFAGCAKSVTTAPEEQPSAPAASESVAPSSEVPETPAAPAEETPQQPEAE